MTKKLTAVLMSLVCLLGIIAAVLPGTTAARAAHIVKGDTTANIKAVQTRLSELGYYTYKIDGLWGWRTTAAVKQFQRDYGLTQDGIVGSWTEKSLKITLSGGSSQSSVSSANLDLLARCVYAEARGEPYTGQVAIAAVVLNRVESPSFPNTISGVIYQKGAFTCVSDGQINLTPDETAIAAARDAMNGWDPTGGCLYYYNPVTATSEWIFSRETVITIGRHVFAI